MSKIPSVPVVVTTTVPEMQSSSATSLREELAAASSEEQRPDGETSESIDGGSSVNITDEPGESHQDGLGSASEEQLSVKDDSRPSSSASTPRSPMRGKLTPSPLDIGPGPESLSRDASPLLRDGGRVSHAKDEGSSHTPPALSKMASVDSPKSPFFIPTNPFQIQVDKMPRFQWSTLHFNLLETVLKSLQDIINKWRRYVMYIWCVA